MQAMIIANSYNLDLSALLNYLQKWQISECITFPMQVSSADDSLKFHKL